MSNGYLIASGADLAAAHEIGEGFGLDVIDAASIHDHATAVSALAVAANVGIVISLTSVRDNGFVALLRSLSLRLQTAQLIFADAEARTELAFLPHQWQAMSLEEARSRAARRRGASQAPAPEALRAAPLPAPADPDPPELAPIPPAPIESTMEPPPFDDPDETPTLAANDTDDDAFSAETPVEPEPQDDAPRAARDTAPADENLHLRDAPMEEAIGEGTPSAEAEIGETRSHDAVSVPEAAEPAAPIGEPDAGRSLGHGALAPPSMSAPAPQAALPIARAKQASPTAAPPKAPADATAFAPKKLRRGTPELVRIVVHQPKQLKDVIMAARKIDARAKPAPQAMSIGDVALGTEVGIALEVRGAACDGALQRRIWVGEPIDFSFTAEAEDDVKQAVFLARVLVGDAQIGVLAFTRGLTGAKKAASSGDVRLKRHKRVFLSYSSADRDTVSAIATAYAMAGVEHFWDRASLKSGEEWRPRLRREIDRADLFHLCWSKAAAQSEWVEKEAEHALTRRVKSNGKHPEITVQMLDGPPWAPHPRHLDSINFDDFVRAAIVGYARGDGQGAP